MTTELLSRIPVERLGWTLLHFLWQGTAISLLYATLRRVLGRSLSAQGRYVLASAALLLLTAAPILTFALNPTSEGPSQSPWSGHATPSQSPWSGHAAPSQFTLRVPQQERLLVLAVALWVAGVVVFSIRLFGGWRFAARLRSASNPPIARWQQTLESLATALGVTRRVRLLISPLVEVPVVVGWLRPAILVPVEFFTGFPAEHIRALLAHELAHVLRHDYLANLLQGLAETILFYHPAVWWISKQIRVEREKCCDDLAVAATGDVAAYVRALAELEARQANRLRVVMAANGGSLLERVRRLIEPAQASPENLPGPAAAWSMTLLWLAGIGAAAVHAAPGPLPVKPFIASPNPIPALVRMQAPSRRQEAFTEIKEKTRKALLYDPLLPAGPGTQSVPAIPLPEAPPALALSTDTSLLASLPGPDLSTGAVRPPREAPIDESPDAAVFHTATRLVLVDVIARGKGSRAAALTQQDFTLFDNGRPQAIAFFSPASALAPRPAPAPLAAGAVSNRLEQDGATPANATVLLIDQRNTPQPDQAFVIPRVRKFLESRRGSGVQSERVGIYAYEPTGDLKVVQELTDDSERLIRAAGALPPRPLIYTDGGVADTTERVLETNDVLEAVARHLATVPGRKNLVWISSGFPTVVSSRDSDLLPDFTPRMEETARVLTDANLAFYAVDARGLLGGFPGMSLSSINMVPNIGSPPFFSPIPPRAPVPTQASSPQTMVSLETWSLDGTDAFDRLANLTGGRTFSNSNGIEDSIQSALDDAALDYTLGFYPSEAVQKPNWHKLKVRVDQRGVRVRYREKYFASPTEASDDTRRALPALLKDPLDATQLQLVAQASPDQERPGCSQVSVSIDLHGLHLEKQNNAWVGAVDVSFQVEGSNDARIVAGKIKISNDQLADAFERGVSLTGSIAVGSGKRELHVVAQDRATGAAGSLRVPLSR